MTYGSNDYLRGHQTQKRCGLCEHHPILCGGRCLDCSVVIPPLFVGDLQPSESEVIAQRPLHSGLEAPVFPTWMHKPIPDEASTGATPQINAEGSGRDESPATSNSYAGAGEVNMSTPSPLAARAEQSQPRSTARSDQTGAPGQPAPPRGRKRRETAAPAAKESKKAKMGSLRATSTKTAATSGCNGLDTEAMLHYWTVTWVESAMRSWRAWPARSPLLQTGHMIGQPRQWPSSSSSNWGMAGASRRGLCDTPCGTALFRPSWLLSPRSRGASGGSTRRGTQI